MAKRVGVQAIDAQIDYVRQNTATFIVCGRTPTDTATNVTRGSLGTIYGEVTVTTANFGATADGVGTAPARRTTIDLTALTDDSADATYDDASDGELAIVGLDANGGAGNAANRVTLIHHADDNTVSFNIGGTLSFTNTFDWEVSGVFT
ncbi:MAG: hypothetical protein AAGA68_27055 [Pseudomonadota bacterium]